MVQCTAFKLHGYDPDGKWPAEYIDEAVYQGNGRFEYLVKWYGFDGSESTMEPYISLCRCKPLLRSFWASIGEIDTRWRHGHIILPTKEWTTGESAFYKEINDPDNAPKDVNVKLVTQGLEEMQMDVEHPEYVDPDAGRSAPSGGSGRRGRGRGARQGSRARSNSNSTSTSNQGSPPPTSRPRHKVLLTTRPRTTGRGQVGRMSRHPNPNSRVHPNSSSGPGFGSQSQSGPVPGPSRRHGRHGRRRGPGGGGGGPPGINRRAHGPSVTQEDFDQGLDEEFAKYEEDVGLYLLNEGEDEEDEEEERVEEEGAGAGVGVGVIHGGRAEGGGRGGRVEKRVEDLKVIEDSEEGEEMMLDY